MLVVTAAQMREMDRLTIEKYGVPSLTLMERAGEAVAQVILEQFARSAKKGLAGATRRTFAGCEP
jgi:NAD(P)H-hydrate repair Nnr-like enzyme with NAD(P)H-hydrate epimerase domain